MFDIAVPDESDPEWVKSQVVRERAIYQRDLTSLAAKLYPHVVAAHSEETIADASIRVASAMIARARELSEVVFPMPVELKAVK